MLTKLSKEASETLRQMQNTEMIKALRKDQDAPKNFGSPVVSANGETAEVYIYDVIAWPFIEAQDIISQVPPNAKTINLHINSPGGSVWEGTAIYNWLKNHSAAINVSVEGLAASMASIIAMVGNEITINRAAFLMIHDPWVVMTGNSEELRKEADLLEKIETTMAGIYAEKSGQDINEIRQWMHEETWFTGEDALSKGLASRTEDGDAPGVTNQFNLSMFTRFPERPAAAAGNFNVQRAASARTDNKNKETKKMNEKLRKMLEAKGLAADATEEQAQDFMKNLIENGQVTDDEKDEMKAEAAKAATKAEKDRQKAIRHHVKIAGLDEKFGEDLIDNDTPLDSAREKIFQKMEQANPPVGAGKINVGTTEGEKFNAAARDGILMRAGVKVEKPAAGAEQFRGFEIASVIRESLQRAGVDITKMHSRRAVADYVIHPQSALSTSDFPSIFRDVANKTLLRAYQEAPATWRPWVNVTSATDFKAQYGISLSEAPDLELVNEHGEYKYGDFSDSQESYRVYKYGKIVQLSWEMIINDDLRAFTRLPQLMGNAARRKEADLVYSLLISNPTMNDGNSLFDDTNHSNYVTSGSGGTISTSTLEAGRLAMRTQKGASGAYLDLRPSFLLVPVAQETTAEVLLRSRGSTEDSKNEQVVNPWYGRLNPIAEPRLDDDSADSWYLVADPNQADTIECAYLDGYEAPVMEEREEFIRDALGWKVKHVFGCGVMDWRTFYKNYGS